MKFLKTLPLSFLIALSVVSCKKDTSDFQQSLIIKKKEVEIQKVKNLTTSNYDVGGTIGCTIRFADHNSPFYGDNDAYDKCFDEQTRKEATLPPGSSEHTQYPEAPDLPVFLDQQFFMGCFWSLLNVPDPIFTLDYAPAKAKLATYNAVIAAVYADPFGNLDIPENVLLRRNKLLSYSGTLPAGIIPYVDFVYSEVFYLKANVATILYDEAPNASGIIVSNTFGIKVSLM